MAVRSSGLTATAAERLRLVPDAGVLAERLDAAEEEVQRLQRAEAVLKLAETALAETMAETYRDFAPRLNAALERNLDRATGGRYRKAFVADDLSVRVEAPETGAVIDLAQVSTGTQRLVYLVQRLELVQLIAPTSEPLPVLLDEPFAHLDRDRMQRGAGGARRPRRRPPDRGLHHPVRGRRRSPHRAPRSSNSRE